MPEAVIVAAARTPIGRAYKGAFNATAGATLGSLSLAPAIERAGIEAGEVGAGEGHRVLCEEHARGAEQEIQVELVDGEAALAGLQHAGQRHDLLDPVHNLRTFVASPK